MKKVIITTLLNILVLPFLFSQAAAYFDPAQAYLRLLLEKDANTVQRIGTFKVVGTSYLFGERHMGSAYAKDASANNVQIGYNTYTQEINVYNTGGDKSIVKSSAEVDSFTLQIEEGESLKNLIFVSGQQVFSKEKVFFQKVYTGTRFSLYKKYYSELGYVSTNYVQSELRQFDLKYEYYYTDTVSKSVKKLKLSNSGVQKEFKSVKDVTPIIGDLSVQSNPEFILTKIMIYLNE